MSRNERFSEPEKYDRVTSREGRVSRNNLIPPFWNVKMVTSREGRVSRNSGVDTKAWVARCHVPRGTCE